MTATLSNPSLRPQAMSAITTQLSLQISAGSTAVIAILQQYRPFLAHSGGI